MRKLLIAISAAASILGAAAGSYLLATPAPLISQSGACTEASQLINCINSAVINLLRGAGQTSPLSVGSWGTVSGATPQTLNTQGGIVTFTGVTAAAVTNVPLTLSNSLVTASSQCVATLVSDNSAATSSPYVRSVVPSAGSLVFNLYNASATVSTGASSFGIGFWCAN